MISKWPIAGNQNRMDLYKMDFDSELKSSAKRQKNNKLSITFSIKMAIIFLIALLFGSQIWAESSFVSKETYRLAFFAPRGEGDPFWGRFIGFMQKAVDDFGMKLTVHYAGGNRERMREQIFSEASSQNKADVLVFPNFKKGGEAFLKIIEANHVPAFVVNSGFTQEETVGEPRGLYQYWIGELLPAEQEVGALLAEKLIAEGLKQFKKTDKENLEMIGITGIVSDYAAIQRTKGLNQVVARFPEIRLRQIVPANWNQNDASTSFAILKKRYPNVTLVWTASDVMAQGVIQSSKKINLIPGKDILVGGIDWAEAGLNAVNKGEQFISIGGHFLEGGWAVVLIYDYLNKHDFANLKLRWRSGMGSVTASEWNSQKKRLAKIKPQFVNFRKYSRFLNKENKNYDFRLEALFGEF